MSTPEQRLRMAEAIKNFEARRDPQGRLVVYHPPGNDGGGAYEVAGINERYDADMCDQLVAMVNAGQFDQAEAAATEYIAKNTDVVAPWSDVAAVEFYLRDSKFNRGLGGVSRILRRTLGTGDTGGVNSETLIALAAAEADVEALLLKLRAAREQYERDVVGVRSNLWHGLLNRWNKSLVAARGFSEPAAGEPGEPAVPPLPPAPIATPRLRSGHRGSAVSAWQTFLRDNGFDPGAIDGVFGPLTRQATIAFQHAHTLVEDGIAGPLTIGKAKALGFDAPAEPPPGPAPHAPGESPQGPASNDFPLRPTFAVLVSTAQRQALFGSFSYVSAPTPEDDRMIRITDTWEHDNIVAVSIPQIRNALGPNGPKTIRFHKQAAAQLQGLWADWETANLLNRILSYAGGFYPRFIGGTTTLSMHAFGGAFDINGDYNHWGEPPVPFGKKGCVYELVPIANKWGFYWGGHFNGRLDAMHFEVAVIKP